MGHPAEVGVAHVSGATAEPVSAVFVRWPVVLADGGGVAFGARKAAHQADGVAGRVLESGKIF